AGQRGDVILLVHLVPATHRAWMLSIPRDLYVPEAGTGDRAKINSALARGPEQLVETIKAASGIPVSHYVLVDFDGFRAVVDAVGGLRLDFPSPVRDDDNGQHNRRLLLPPPGPPHRQRPQQQRAAHPPPGLPASGRRAGPAPGPQPPLPVPRSRRR